MAVSNLTLRIATAVVAVPLLLALLYVAPPWAWAAFIAAASIIAIREFASMTHPSDTVAFGCQLLLVWASVFAVYSWPTASHWLLAVFLLVPFASILLTLWRLGDVPTTGFRMAASTFGPLWLGAGLGSVVLLRTAPDGASLVLLCLALAWASDTGGYIAGRLLGKRKLYEAVSPKKTIEGAVGGTIAAIAASVIISIYLLDRMPIEHAVALGLVGSLGGVAGDLGESLLKRSTGVKDSGGIVPGHGGLLDRIDAVVVTAPITALYVVWAGWLPVAAP